MIAGARCNPWKLIKAKRKNICPIKNEARPKTKYASNNKKTSPTKQKNKPNPTRLAYFFIEGLLNIMRYARIAIVV